MILRKIQRQIEALYRFEVGYQIEDFLTSIQLSTEKNIKVGSRFEKETLIIKQSPDQVELALFMDPSILNSLEKEDPFESLDGHNLNPFCTAVEGVSHFLYFINRADENQPITQLELEIQAEIDKYLLASLLYNHQKGEVPAFLFPHLFENFGWDQDLNKTDRARYEEANHFAAKFCAYLERNYIRTKRWRDALEVARNFYHFNHWEKIRSLTP